MMGSISLIFFLVFCRIHQDRSTSNRSFGTILEERNDCKTHTYQYFILDLLFWLITAVRAHNIPPGFHIPPGCRTVV